MDNLTPLAKAFLVAGPLLSAGFVALKLTGPLSGWSWWWTPVPLILVAVVALAFVMWINLSTGDL